MSYNKAREEKKWLLWKDAEEKNLRQLGVSEDKIKHLRDMDWEDFKSERRFYEHSTDLITYIDRQADNDTGRNVRTVENLLDDIENGELHRLLLSVDKLTLQIVIWKMDGYTSAEISTKTGLSINSIDLRIWHLKRKMKNIL